MNAFAERWVLSVKSECLDKMILFGEGHLCVAPSAEYLDALPHAERPHQGIGNERIIAGEPSTGRWRRGRAAERLGGLLQHYHRAAA